MPDSSSCCPQGNSEDFNGTVKTSVSPVLRWVSTGVAAGPGEKVARATRERQKFPLRERQATEEKVYNPEDGSRPGPGWLRRVNRANGKVFLFYTGEGFAAISFWVIRNWTLVAFPAP